MNNEILVEAKNIKKYYPIRAGIFLRIVNHVKAVDGVSLNIYKGETLGIVGESGCGKSTLARVIVGLQPATDGEVYFEGKVISELNRAQIKEVRRKMQIIFQDPYESLNPRMTVGEIVSEGLRIHNIYSRVESDRKVKELLDKVGLRQEFRLRYPHEFSGGQRQRIGIARALAINPEFIVCDEPVSALDVSVQAQILNLLKDLQQELGLTYMFISHGLNIVKYLSNRVGVMYLGKIVEIAKAEELFRHPAHPYTKALISAIPEVKVNKSKKKVILQGDVPSPITPPLGCRFHPRCGKCMDICREKEPKLKADNQEHYVACHLIV